MGVANKCAEEEKCLLFQCFCWVRGLVGFGWLLLGKIHHDGILPDARKGKTVPCLTVTGSGVHTCWGHHGTCQKASADIV